MQKKIFFIMFLFYIGNHLHQLSAQEVIQKEMPARMIYVAFDKTKHIVLPAPVSDISFARADYIEAERVKAAPYIVRLTTQEEAFTDTTNLTIVCTDGSVWPFRICYLPEGQKDDYIIYTAGKQIKSYNVKINNINEISMFFPSDIIYCKQGNEEVLGIEYYNNMLRALTTFDSIPESNIFVVGNNHDLYEITVNYGFPETYVYNFDDERKYVAHINVNSIEMKNFIDKVKRGKRNIHSVGVIKNKFEMSLANLYVYNQFMFFAFDIKNFSNIDYDIDFVKCFFRDRKTNKNAIQQEVQVMPVYQKDFDNRLRGKSDNRFILVFNRFTIPDDKIFHIEMFEKGGGRHMQIEILNEYIISAQLLR